MSVTVFATGRHSTVDDFRLVLSSPTGATLGDPTATARLTSRNGLLSVRVTDTARVRSASAPTVATVAVSLSAAPAPGETVTVAVSTVDGSAVAGSDFTGLNSVTVTFAAGETTKLVTIPVAARPAGTPNRSFSLVLSNPSAAVVIADASAVVTLLGP